MRSTHLRHTTRGGPTCQNGRSAAALRGEHITVDLARFQAASPDLQCRRCKGSRLFAFLARHADRVTA